MWYPSRAGWLQRMPLSKCGRENGMETRWWWAGISPDSSPMANLGTWSTFLRTNVFQESQISGFQTSCLTHKQPWRQSYSGLPQASDLPATRKSVWLGKKFFCENDTFLCYIFALFSLSCLICQHYRRGKENQQDFLSVSAAASDRTPEDQSWRPCCFAKPPWAVS